MSFNLKLNDTSIYPVDQLVVDQLAEWDAKYSDIPPHADKEVRIQALNELDSIVSPSEPELPRLEDVTTEYLDNIAKRLQHDTFSEQAKQSFDEAWQQHYAQLETAAIMFHGDGNDLTLCCKLIDSRIRNLEYEMESLVSYANRLKNQNEDHVVNDPEITVNQQEDIDNRIGRMREQYAYIKNMHYVLKTRVRPEIERRTGYTMDAYKSKAQLDTERKTKKWSHFRKRVTMDVYMSWTPKQRQAYTEKYGRRVQ